MHLGINGRLAIVLGVAGATLSAVTSLQAKPSVQPSAMECEVKVESTLPISSEPVAVQAEYTEAIGDSVSASFPAESGIAVVSLEASDSAQTVQLTLNTAEANEGEWTLTLKGTTGECQGKVKTAK